MPVTKGVKKLIEEAMAQIETMSTAEAIAAHGGDDVVFVDLRDVRELEREGMIPGAFHAPRGMLEFWVDPDSPYHKDIFSEPGKTFVLYCQSAWRSVLATKTLNDMGMKNVKQFENGFSGWKEAGGPVAERPKKSG
ncbi:MAG: rhodanese-like domain-containing protein [Rhodospirillales bacterium]|nr:rhodanese-like domain-containing protein [Rhodospirillales bacterium]